MLYGSCTIGIYNNDAVLCVFTQDYCSWRRSEIEEFHVVQWLYRALCAAVSAWGGGGGGGGGRSADFIVTVPLQCSKLRSCSCIHP